MREVDLCRVVTGLYLSQQGEAWSGRDNGLLLLIGISTASILPTYFQTSIALTGCLRLRLKRLKGGGNGQRHRQTIFPSNQTGDSFPRPEVEGPFQLIQHLAHSQAAGALRLSDAQPSALSKPAAPALRFQGAQPADLVDCHPLVHRTQAYSPRPWPSRSV